MDFFEHQSAARRQTGRLIFYFVLAVAAIVVAIYVVVLLAMVFVAGDSDRPGQSNPYMETPWHLDLFLMVALATIGVILVGSLYKTSQLAAGGEADFHRSGWLRCAQTLSSLISSRVLSGMGEA